MAQLREQLEGIPLGAIRTIDGAAPDPAAEAARHAAVLEEAPIDLAVLGLGATGTSHSTSRPRGWPPAWRWYRSPG